MAKQVTHLDSLLTRLGKLWPVSGNWGVKVELSAIGQDQGTQSGHRLGGREHVDDRVALPRLAGRRVPVAAPDIHDRLAVQQHGDRGADIYAAVEVAGERLGDAPKLSSKSPWISATQ